VTVRALALLASAMVLTAITILLGTIVLVSLFGMFRESLRYGQIIGGGMADGFPFELAVVVFILAKWSREIWMAWSRLRLKR
jgi:hypothetical protein